MKLNPEEIQVIKDMAGFFYTPAEIAINLQVDPDDFKAELKKKESELFEAYKTGLLTGDLRLRSGIMKAAEHGSHPAQQLMWKIKEDSEIKAQTNV